MNHRLKILPWLLPAAALAVLGCSENWKANPDQPTSRTEQETSAQEVAPSGAAQTEGR